MTDIINDTAVVNSDGGRRFETTCERSGFRLRRGDSLLNTWDELKTLPRFGEANRHPQDLIRGKKYPAEGATSERPRQDDLEINSKTWNGSSWTQGTDGITDPVPGDF